MEALYVGVIYMYNTLLDSNEGGVKSTYIAVFFCKINKNNKLDFKKTWQNCYYNQNKALSPYQLHLIVPWE